MSMWEMPDESRKNKPLNFIKKKIEEKKTLIKSHFVIT